MSGRKVVIVEDSCTMRILLESIIEDDPRLELIASYSTAERAIANLDKDAPDVISLDIILPGMDGHEATKALIERRPTPIVVISSTVADQMDGTMKALKNGALSALPKPDSPESPSFERESRELRDALYNMSYVKVIQQFPRRTIEPAKINHGRTIPLRSTPPIFSQQLEQMPKLIAVGSSTGGPAALEVFFNALTPEAHPPILIVQHISPGFTDGLSDWLESVTPHQFSLARNGDPLVSGRIYIAPDACHLKAGKDCITLANEPSDLMHTPSIDVLFDSVANSFGDQAAGILLTGMGQDGARGLLRLKQSGSWTAAQDEASCVVYGMPRAAIELNAACAQMTVAAMAEQINKRIKG